MQMPKSDMETLSRRDEIARALSLIVPGEGVITDPDSLRIYDCDGLTAYRQPPMLVVLPQTTEQVSQILRYCALNKIKIVARGAGTSLSGGALPLADGIILGMSKFSRIVDVDLANRCAVVEPGVTNLAITKAVEHHGFYYAPDPSSQIACTIGGNVAENSGGIHCLKYGLTANNILGVKAVLMDGSIIETGGKMIEPVGGYDVMGILTGSEGLLAIITQITVRLLPRPQFAQAALIGFGSVAGASEMVADIISSGIIPAGMEMMDKIAAGAAEAYIHAGYPTQDEALLIVELDGSETEVAEQMARIETLAREHHATSIRLSQNEHERELFWAGRKNAFPAVGRLAPDYYCMDGTIPRAQIAHVLQEITRFSKKYNLGVANVFHAGDGNLHPLILYDAQIAGQLETAEAFGRDILKLCVDVGGVLTGEHGVGVEKRDLMHLMFSEEDLNQQQRLKCAFDPHHLLNPGKMFPQLRRCAELGRMHIHHNEVPFPDLERF